MLWKIVEPPQARSYYIPAHPEVESLEANFQTKLLVIGRYHHVVLLLLPIHVGNAVLQPIGGWVEGEAWADTSVRGSTTSGIL